MSVTLILPLALVGAGLTLSSCSSSDQSVAAYCQTFYQQGSQIRSEFSNSGASSDPLATIADLFSVPVQLANFFQKLASVAPDSIEPDVQDLQNAFQQEANSLGNDITDPLGGLASGIAESLEYAPAWNAVNNWTESNCKSYAPT
jgi:hypothetical protein